MKLAQQYNRANIFTSLMILLLSGGVYYFAIHYILTSKLDNDLNIEEQEIIGYAKRYNKLPFPGDFKNQKITYQLQKKGTAEERHYTSTRYFNNDQKHTEPGRSLITGVHVAGKDYIVNISKSSLESEDLFRLIFMITLGVLILLLLSLLLINRFVLSHLWSSFYEMLKQLKMFNVADNLELSAPPTQIDEFQELNQAVLAMAKRARQDYKELKNFTDNASHEMMTPLAVINSKLDTLIQTGALSDRQGELIADVYLAVSRISRLNQSLLLMAKIENNLIKDEENVELSELISQKINQFSELLQSNSIFVEQHLTRKELYINKYLADILLNNLISNAIRHNKLNGVITVQLSDTGLIISNTGLNKALDENRVFERFYKNASSEGSGLGLAISSQIAMLYRLQLKYGYDSGKHVFSIEF